MPENVKELEQNICHQCGKRTSEDLIRGKCFKCRQEEIKKLGGKKLIKCADCGCDVIIPANVKKKYRCDNCQEKYIREYDRNRKRK